MSFPRYPKYKASGVEWLREVPEHWDVPKFRHRFTESPEKIEDTVVGPMLSVSGYRGIEVKEYDDENRRRLDEELVGYRIVRPGQLVVNSMWLNAAGLGVSEFEGHVSPAYRSYWFDRQLDRRFIHHLMRSAAYVQGYTSMAHQRLQPRLEATLKRFRPQPLQHATIRVLRRNAVGQRQVLLQPRGQPDAFSS